jgi:hypothetical protein
MRKLFAFTMAGILAACSVAAPDTMNGSGTAGLAGTDVTIDDERTSTDPSGGVESSMTVDGERVTVSLFDGALRIEAAAKTLVLRDEGGTLVASFVAETGGERSTTRVPTTTLPAADAFAQVRGQLAAVARDRYAVGLDAALHAIAAWPAPQQESADRLLASFLLSLPRVQEPASDGVGPRWSDDIAMDETVGGCSSTCGLLTVDKGGCSVSCSGGYCAMCREGGDAVSCYCTSPTH